MKHIKLKYDIKRIFFTSSYNTCIVIMIYLSLSIMYISLRTWTPRVTVDKIIDDTAEYLSFAYKFACNAMLLAKLI